MKVFLDFEASSLADRSHPIEVAWVFQNGRQESHLIMPAPNWTDWDDEAEAIHHITREMLAAEGEPHDEVARRVVEALSGHDLFASAPSWDGKWLSTLLRSAGIPRHELRLKDTDEALRETALEILSTAYSSPRPDGIGQRVFAQSAIIFGTAEGTASGSYPCQHSRKRTGSNVPNLRRCGSLEPRASSRAMTETALSRNPVTALPR